VIEPAARIFAWLEGWKIEVYADLLSAVVHHDVLLKCLVGSNMHGESAAELPPPV
jgi:hypothetical protein